MNLEDIKAKLIKMKALAKSGEGGERENAERLINELAARYNISLDFLGNETKRRYDIKFGTRWERALFSQLLALLRIDKYGNRDAEELGLFYELGGSALKCYTICTDMEWLELTAKYSVLRSDYRSQLANFYMAFLMANDLLLPCREDAPDATPEEEEKYLKAKRLSHGIFRSNTFDQIDYKCEVDK